MYKFLYVYNAVFVRCVCFPYWVFLDLKNACLGWNLSHSVDLCSFLGVTFVSFWYFSKRLRRERIFLGKSKRSKKGKSYRWTGNRICTSKRWRSFEEWKLAGWLRTCFVTGVQSLCSQVFLECLRQFMTVMVRSLDRFCGKQRIYPFLRKDSTRRIWSEVGNRICNFTSMPV